MHGIIVVDKPKGYTSRDVVNVVSKVLHTKKVGHTGTLDPLATGVLVLCLGDYTKLVSLLTNHDKEYIATIQFGLETDTLDITGKVLHRSESYPSREELEQVLKKFMGVQTQEVPLYSAKKINGKRLYEYAREEKAVSLPTQTIEVQELELLSYQDNQAVIRAKVSKGTYIRSLVRDISHALHTYGVMSDLRRTKLGTFDESLALSFDKIQSGDFILQSFTCCFRYDVKEIDEQEFQVVKHRNELDLSSTFEYVLLKSCGKEIALYVRHGHRYKPLLFIDKSI